MELTGTKPPENVALGIGMVLAATLIFSLSDVFSKVLLETISPLQASWMRSVVVALITLPFAFLRLGPHALATAHPATQTFRGASVLLSSLCFLTGLSYLPVADAVALNFISPILLMAFAAPILGERVSTARWLAAAFGFLGVLIILRPGTGAFQPAALWPLAAATLWSFVGVITRRMMVTERPETTLAWSAIIAVAALSFLTPLDWKAPTQAEIVLAVLIGIGSAAAHGLFVFAFERARPSRIAPFTYVQIVWTTWLGYIVLGTAPDAWTLTGMAVIVASGIYTARRA